MKMVVRIGASYADSSFRTLHGISSGPEASPLPWSWRKAHQRGIAGSTQGCVATEGVLSERWWELIVQDITLALTITVNLSMFLKWRNHQMILLLWVDAPIKWLGVAIPKASSEKVVDIRPVSLFNTLVVLFLAVLSWSRWSPLSVFLALLKSCCFL